MKIYKTHGVLILLMGQLMFGMGLAQATSTFNGSAALTITIDNITGANANSSILGTFELDESASEVYIEGDGISDSPQYTGGLLNGGGIGDSFSQIFSVNGSASIGSVEVNHSAAGEFVIDNTAGTNDLTVEFTFDYNLQGTVSGEEAQAVIGLNYFDSAGNIDGFDEAYANIGEELISTAQNSETYTEIVLAGEDYTFGVDSSIFGTAVSQVPVPGALYLFGTALLGVVSVKQGRKKMG